VRLSVETVFRATGGTMRIALRGSATAAALALAWVAGVGCSSTGHSAKNAAEKAAPAHASSSPAPASPAAPASARIIQAAFNEDADGARYVVSANAPLLYTSYEPRPDLLIVDLRDATVAPSFVAPKTGGDIVESIKNLASFVSEIARASAEQSDGVDHVNKALSMMDQVTQQNSALVEENAATAKTLEHQAAAMRERVGTFRFDAVEESAGERPVKTAARAPSAAAGAASAVRKPSGGSPVYRSGEARRGPVGRLQSTLATALKAEPECEEF